MRKIGWLFGVLLLVSTIQSCQRFPNPFADNPVLAEVGDQTLYKNDLAVLFSSEMLPEDSVKVLQSYVDQWVKKQLKIQEAEQMFLSSEEDIDLLVNDYRNSLLTHKVDQFYVDQRLDTLFTPQQIKEYYDKNRTDFILDKTVLQARVVKIPKDSRQEKKIKELMLSGAEQDMQDLVEMCTKNGFGLMEINQWSGLPALTALLPTDRDTNYDYLLTQNKVYEFMDREYSYLAQTIAVRNAGDVAPLESVSEVIRRVIFNQRKQDIIKAHEDSLFRQAMVNKKIVVNVK